MTVMRSISTEASLHSFAFMRISVEEFLGNDFYSKTDSV